MTAVLHHQLDYEPVRESDHLPALDRTLLWLYDPSKEQDLLFPLLAESEQARPVTQDAEIQMLRDTAEAVSSRADDDLP